MNNILAGYWANAFDDVRLLRDNGTISARNPADGSVLDDFWSRRVRQAYWAALTYTDVNVGGIVAAAKASGLWQSTVVVLWGDHGYQLGDNDQWSKVSNFEQSLRIPLMIRVPGTPSTGRRTSALWEAVDLLPTVTDLAMGIVPPPCPKSLVASRAERLCTDGKSAAPLLVAHSAGAAAAWKQAAFSQVPRGRLVQGEPGDEPGEAYMGYSVRVAEWRYNEWVRFDNQTGTADWRQLVGRELYAERLGETCAFDTDFANVAAEPAHADLVRNLSALLRTIV